MGEPGWTSQLSACILMTLLLCDGSDDDLQVSSFFSSDGGGCGGGGRWGPAFPLLGPKSNEDLLDSRFSCVVCRLEGVDALIALTGTTLNGDTDDLPSKLFVLHFGPELTSAGLHGTTKGLLSLFSLVFDRGLPGLFNKSFIESDEAMSRQVCPKKFLILEEVGFRSYKVTAVSSCPQKHAHIKGVNPCSSCANKFVSFLNICRILFWRVFGDGSRVSPVPKDEADLARQNPYLSEAAELFPTRDAPISIKQSQSLFKPKVAA